MTGVSAVVIVLCAVALLVWAFEKYIPMPQPWKNIIAFIVCAFTALWMLSLAGVVPSVKLGG